MRSIFNGRTALGAVALVLGLGVSSSYAAAGDTLQFNVKFPFLLHGETFPAGQYTVTREGSSVFLIRGQNGSRDAAFVNTIPAEGRAPSVDPALTFSRYEKQYRLTNVWQHGNEGRRISTR